MGTLMSYNGTSPTRFEDLELGQLLQELSPEWGMGVKGFLQKPFHFADFAQRIRAVIES